MIHLVVKTSVSTQFNLQQVLMITFRNVYRRVDSTCKHMATYTLILPCQLGGSKQNGTL